jgi:glucans biosynthesis protein
MFVSGDERRYAREGPLYRTNFGPLIKVTLFLVFLTSATGAMAGAFGFNDVVDKARQSAGKPYQAVPDSQIPDFLKNITYDQWRDIRYKNSKTLWGEENVPFKIRFFHPGFLYKWPVNINYVDDSGAHRILFSPGDFDYGKNDFQGKIPAGLGFAGFRIHYPINKPDYADELAVFLGATYFRAVGRNQLYGMSARGLAVNTASDGGEEFPSFKEFWILKPQPADKQITVYALMDSPSLSGAYQYIIHPGARTTMEVSSVIFTRKKIEKLGVAPMTSMFLFGENSQHPGNDFRPQVHDSDGLLVHTKAGEWIWRALVNPPKLLINTFEVGTPAGFGLFQRDLNFDHYQDLETRFDLRPSLWVTPGQDWGQGHVELVEIPSDSEYNDNINAFWVPQKPPEAGETLKFSYTMQWCRDAGEEGLGRVAGTRVVNQSGDEGAKFVIDFQGKNVNDVPAEKKLDAEIDVSKGYKIMEEQTFKNQVTGGWRLVFKMGTGKQDPLKDVLPDKRPPADLRSFLKEGDRTLTETWTYTLK